MIMAGWVGSRSVCAVLDIVGALKTQVCGLAGRRGRGGVRGYMHRQLEDVRKPNASRFRPCNDFAQPSEPHDDAAGSGLPQVEHPEDARGTV